MIRGDRRQWQPSLVEIGDQWDIDAVNGCHFLLGIDATYGWLDHYEAAGLSVLLEFHSSDSHERDLVKEGLGQRNQRICYLRSRGTASGKPDIRRPNADFPSDKGA